LQELEEALATNVTASRIDGHIKDDIFVNRALEFFDASRADGVASA